MATFGQDLVDSARPFLQCSMIHLEKDMSEVAINQDTIRASVELPQHVENVVAIELQSFFLPDASVITSPVVATLRTIATGEEVRLETAHISINADATDESAILIEICQMLTAALRASRPDIANAISVALTLDYPDGDGAFAIFVGDADGLVPSGAPQYSLRFETQEMHELLVYRLNLQAPQSVLHAIPDPGSEETRMAHAITGELRAPIDPSELNATPRAIYIYLDEVPEARPWEAVFPQRGLEDLAAARTTRQGIPAGVRLLGNPIPRLRRLNITVRSIGGFFLRSVEKLMLSIEVLHLDVSDRVATARRKPIVIC